MGSNYPHLSVLSRKIIIATNLRSRGEVSDGRHDGLRYKEFGFIWRILGKRVLFWHIFCFCQIHSVLWVLLSFPSFFLILLIGVLCVHVKYQSLYSLEFNWCWSLTQHTSAGKSRNLETFKSIRRHPFLICRTC